MRAARAGQATGRTWRWQWRPARRPACRPGRLEADRRVVLQHQHHLEQRMPRQRARRVDHLHQPLERQLLVAVGRQIGRPHPRDQLAQARIARGVGAQHQRVDEEPDQIVERAVGAARDRAADRDVVAGAQPRQQGRQAACSTMNRLAPLSRASASRLRCSSGPSVSGTLSPRWLATAGRTRSLGSSI